jgi:hypothetical protein
LLIAILNIELTSINASATHGVAAIGNCRSLSDELKRLNCFAVSALRRNAAILMQSSVTTQSRMK